jgi:hypothetical protein
MSILVKRVQMDGTELDSLQFRRKSHATGRLEESVGESTNHLIGENLFHHVSIDGCERRAFHGMRQIKARHKAILDKDADSIAVIKPFDRERTGNPLPHLMQDQAVKVGKSREELDGGHEQIEAETANLQRGDFIRLPEGERTAPPFKVFVWTVADHPDIRNLRIQQVPEDLSRAGLQHDGE